MSLAHPPVDCGPYRIHSLQEVACGTAYPKPPARTGHPVDILYVTASGGRLVCGGRTDTLKLGTAVICTAGEYSLQSEDAACPLRFFHLRLSFHPVSPQDETAQMAEALTREPVRILHDLYRLHGVFTALFDELETEEMYRSRLIESLLHQLAVYLYRGSLPESPVRSGPEIPDLVSAIRDCLGRHILYMRHVGELEERLCYSYPHLSRRYRRETGRSLKEDFDLRRMERAAELLLDGVSVSEAAEVLGYTKSQTFVKIILPQMFKRVLPSVTNEVITLVKDTSMAFVLAYAEMFTIAKQISAAKTTFMPLFVAGLFYFIFNGVVDYVMGRSEKRMRYYN